MRRFGGALVAMAVAVGACSGGATRSPAASPGPTLDPATGIEMAVANVPREEASPTDARAAASGINDFGLELFAATASSDHNAVVSPTSIVLALAMARAGARGATATEMDAVLRAVASDDHAAWLNALDQALAGRSGSFPDAEGTEHEVTLRIANAPFAQRDMVLEAAYLEALASRFGAGLRLVDYVRETEAARRLINGWVDEQTEQRIPELLGPGVLSTDTRLTLVNAIYLKAAWQMPFFEGATVDAPFSLAEGSLVEVPMMTASYPFGYAAGDGWQAVELPYVGEALAMTIVVPDDLASFEASVDADRLDEIVASLETRHVDLTLPRFGIETKASLPRVLAEMGMPSAFGAGADFSGITREANLAISDVIHQANIDVDEEGTEAAAATAVVMELSGPVNPVRLSVDQPFLFALRDRETGVVLFLGHVADPSIGR